MCASEQNTKQLTNVSVVRLLQTHPEFIANYFAMCKRIDAVPESNSMIFRDSLNSHYMDHSVSYGSQPPPCETPKGNPRLGTAFCRTETVRMTKMQINGLLICQNIVHSPIITNKDGPSKRKTEDEIKRPCKKARM